MHGKLQMRTLSKQRIEMENDCSALCSTAAGDGGVDTNYIWLQRLTTGTCLCFVLCPGVCASLDMSRNATPEQPYQNSAACFAASKIFTAWHTHTNSTPVVLIFLQPGPAPTPIGACTQ